MSSSTDERQELSVLMTDIGEKLTEESYTRFCELLDELGLYDDENNGPLPFETWMGIAQVIADASGYKVVLQAAILEPVKDDPNSFRTIGHREIASADPTFFVKEAAE